MGSIWAKRSSTARDPKSGEHDDHTAPSDAVARNATRVSTEFGTSATTRSPRPDAGRGQARAGPRDQVAQLGVR